MENQDVVESNFIDLDSLDLNQNELSQLDKKRYQQSQEQSQFDKGSRQSSIYQSSSLLPQKPSGSVSPLVSSPFEVNSVYEEFSNFWEETQLEEGQNGNDRKFDHSCSVSELQDKYQFDGQDGLKSDQVHANAKLASAIQNKHLLNESELHWWRINRYLLWYRYSIGVAAMIFFTGFIYDSNRAWDLVLSIILIIIVLFVGCFWNEPHGQRDWSLKKCEVIRDGRPVEIYPIDVVIGDLLTLKSGTILPVDTRVVSIRTNEKSKDKILRSNWGWVLGKTAEDRVLTTACTNPADWKRSRNIVLQGQMITSGQGLGIAISTYRESSRQVEIEKNSILKQQGGSQYSILRYRRRTAGDEIRFYVTVCSIIGLISAIIGGLISFFALDLNVIMSLLVSGWVILAFTPVGLVTQISVARWISRRSQEVSTEFMESISDSPCICADLTLLGGAQATNVVGVWVNERMQSVDEVLTSMQFELMLPSLLKLHASFLATEGMCSQESNRRFQEEIAFEKAMHAFFQKLPSTEFFKRTMPPAMNFFENQAVVPIHEDVSFAMKVVRESTGIGNLVAYIRGDPRRILEISRTYDYEGELRGLNKKIANRILKSIDTKNERVRRSGSFSLNRSLSNQSSSQNSKAAAKMEMKVIAFARMEIKSEDETIFERGDFFFNTWGEVKFGFDDFSFLGCVVLEQKVAVLAKLPKLQPFMKVVFFSDYDFHTTIQIAKCTEIIPGETRKSQTGNRKKDARAAAAAAAAANSNIGGNKIWRRMEKKPDSIDENDQAAVAAAAAAKAFRNGQIEGNGIVTSRDMLVNNLNWDSSAFEAQIRVFSGLTQSEKIEVIQRLRSSGHGVGFIVNSINQLKVANAADITLSSQMSDGETLGTKNQENGKANNVIKEKKNKYGVACLTDFELEGDISSAFKSIETSVEFSKQEIENLRKIFAVFAAVKSAEIAAVLAYYILGIPFPLSPLMSVLLTGLIIFLPLISLIFEKDGHPVATASTRQHSANEFRLVTARLVFYSHVVLGSFAIACGFVCYFFVMIHKGFSPQSLFGMVWRELVVPNSNYLRGYNLPEASLYSQIIRQSYNYGESSEAGTAINKETPYWSYHYMREGNDCNGDSQYFSFTEERIDWISQDNIELNLRKRLNYCDVSTGVWRTSVDWTYSDTEEIITFSINNIRSSYSPSALRSGQTAFMVGLVFFVFGCVIAVKSLRYSTFKTNMNWIMVIAVILMFGVAVFITAVPGIVDVFGIGRFPAQLWGFPASIFIVLLLIFEEARKIIIKKFIWLEAMTDF